MSLIVKSAAEPEILERLRSQGFRVFTKGNFNLNIVSERTIPGRPNEFDDRVHVVYRDAGQWVHWSAKSTSDPGLYYAKKPINVKGTASLCPGQYPGAWVIGRHKGEYSALVQDRPVSVWRDRDRDGSPDRTSPVDTGIFGINFHRANAGRASVTVDRWSAGCQVIADPLDFDEFMALVTRSAVLYGSRFTGSLIETINP